MALAAFLKHRLKLYVVFLWDVIHETVNAVGRALQKCKLDVVVQEIILAWKLPWGPWANLGFHSKIKSAATAFSQIYKSSCDGSFMWLSEKAPASCVYVNQYFAAHLTFVLPSFFQVDPEIRDATELENVWKNKGTRPSF